MEKTLIKLLLSHSFYESNKGRLARTMFPDALGSLYDAIADAHEKYERDITFEELRQLYRINNPNLTRAARSAIEELIQDIEAQPDVGTDIAEDVLKHMWRVEIGRRVADIGLSLMDGKEDSLLPLQTLVEKTSDDFVPEDTSPAVTTDITELLTLLDSRSCWQFNLRSLAEYVPGLSGGEFMIWFARPEMGKTAGWVSLCAGPEGFAAQGAVVHAFINEEPAIRTMMRAISSYTGLTREQIRANPARAKQLFEPIRQRLKMIDDVDMTMERLDAYCRQHKPDIVVIDQLDKVQVNGTFTRTDEKLRAIYVYAREIAKRHNCTVIGICQASADAEGKAIVNYSMMEGSKTGKAAEADVIVGVGRYTPEGANMEEDMSRTLHVSKNKISGRHGTVSCILNKNLSRYEA